MRIISRMAFDSNGIKFLLYARKVGVDFTSTATIGRQFNYAPAAEIRDLFARAGADPVSDDRIQDLLEQNNGFSEGIFELLGAQKADSFDASDFEGSTHVHDFNFPIPDAFKNSYSTVLDGGTLEHVFNYPTALRNCMEMVAEDGHFLAITPANNFPGHGFYQFSPELFFRVFTADNGFEMVDAIFMEDYPEAPWFRVEDPASRGHRVTFENTRPAYLLLIARRTMLKPVFERFPQQSDYAAAWRLTSDDDGNDTKVPSLLERIPGAVSRRWRKLTQPRAIRYRSGDLVKFDPFDRSISSTRTP